MSKLAGISRRWAVNVMVVALGFGAGAVMAQSVTPKAAETGTAAARPIVAHMTQMRVVTDAGGKETLQDASSIRPGDIVEYRVTYTNNGKQPVKDLVATMPLPVETEYLPKTAKPGVAIAQAAAVDGRYAPEPLMRKVAGKTDAQPVPYTEYRSLRWPLGQLPAGGVTEVSARVRVLTSTAPVAQAATSPAR